MDEIEQYFRHLTTIRTTKADLAEESLEAFMKEQAKYQWDRFTLISFHDKAKVLVESQPFGYSFKDLK
jgi:hypothetical protein